MSERLRPPGDGNSSKAYSHVGRGSEVDLMSAIYPLSVHRRIERQWAERIKSLKQMRGQTVIGTERTVPRVFYNEGPKIRVPARSVVLRQQIDGSKARD